MSIQTNSTSHKAGLAFPKSYIVVFFFQDLRRDVDVPFVDICEIVDHPYLN